MVVAAFKLRDFLQYTLNALGSSKLQGKGNLLKAMKARATTASRKVKPYQFGMKFLYSQ